MMPSVIPVDGEAGVSGPPLWFASRGAAVFTPLFHSSRDVDLIADGSDGVQRVQVETPSKFRKRRWEVTVCPRGGNRSWSGLVKRLDRSDTTTCPCSPETAAAG